MKSFSSSIKLLLQISIPPIACSMLFFIIDWDISYHVLFFSLLIVLSNPYKLKYNLPKSIILSIILSFITFSISLGLYLGIGLILMLFMNLDRLEDYIFMGNNLKHILKIFPISIFSPLLMFKCYNILFQIERTPFIKKVRIITILVLIVTAFFMQKPSNSYFVFIWQFSMVFALQLILFKKEIKAILNKKKRAI